MPRHERGPGPARSRDSLRRFRPAFALLLVACGAPAAAPPAPDAEEEELPVHRKQDAVPPLFVDGPPLEPAQALEEWIAARTARRPQVVLRVPFTFWDEPRRAALGLVREREGAALCRLDDTALGVALDERLRALQGAEGERCAVWLSVRAGPLIGPAPSEGSPVFAVLEVHERVPADAQAGALRAQAARGDEELAIRLLRRLHCARGTARCAQCQVAAAEPPAPALLDVAPDGDAARPTIAIERGGRTTHVPFDVLRRFATRAEAQAFAARHELSDVRLEGEPE